MTPAAAQAAMVGIMPTLNRNTASTAAAVRISARLPEAQGDTP